MSETVRAEESNAKNVYGAPPKININLPQISELTRNYKRWKDVQLPLDILLLTVNECEFLSCYHYIVDPFRSYCRGLGNVYFGSIGEDRDVKLKVALMKYSGGPKAPDSSLSVVKNAVTHLKPKAVFSVGHCSGMNQETTKLGDLVLSVKLTTYSYQKVTKDHVEVRGITTPVSRDIAKLIRHACFGWNTPLENPKERNIRVHLGEVLSGSELEQAEWRQNELGKLFPGAVAIETEGQGFSSAARDLKMEWVVVKGISSYADETEAEESWKTFASVTAASFVATILNDCTVFEDWPHYKGVSTEEESLVGPMTKVKIREDAKTSCIKEMPSCESQAESLYQMKSLLYAESEGCLVDHQGTTWNLKDIQADACITFTQDAVSKPLFFGCKLLEPTVDFPPLNKDERLVSSVIELNCEEQPRIHFTGESKGKVVIAFSHSAPKLKGYEVVIGELVSSDRGYEWNYLETTNNWQISDVVDDSAKPRFPYAEAKITHCGTFGVIYRLKSYKYSIKVSANKDITYRVPEYPEVSLTIPAENVRGRSNLDLILKVQEIPRQWFDCGEEFAGPVLHIMCPQITDLLTPATITLPLLLQGDKDELLKLSATDVRVFKYRPYDERADWDEITMQLPHPAVLMNGVVRFQVKHFCRFKPVSSKKRQLRGRLQVDDIDHIARPFPLEAGFLACLCNTVDMPPEHAQLRLYCYPAHLQYKVLKRACSAHYIDRYGNADSLYPLCNTEEIYVELWKRSKARKELILRFRYDDKFETETIVRLPKEGIPYVKFFQRLGKRSPQELCELSITTPGEALKSIGHKKITGGLKRSKEEPSLCKVSPQKKRKTVKQGVPSNDELEFLSTSIGRNWMELGLRLKISETTLKEIEDCHKRSRGRAYEMLLLWKKREGSDATYKVLHNALCHPLVERRDLADEYCCG